MTFQSVSTFDLMIINFAAFKKVNYDQIKKSQKAEKEEIEEDMLNMVQSMKEYSNNFKTQLQQDEAIIKRVEDQQDQNIDLTKKA